MFKKEIYNYIAGILSDKATEQGLKIDTSYEAVYYGDNAPTAVELESGNAWEAENIDVIPLTVLYDHETPSVNESDRSEFSVAYGLFYDVSKRDEVALMLENYRSYMFANKTATIDGYNVAFKVVRGDKGKTFVQSGRIYGVYTLNIYITSSLAYLVKKTDSLNIKLSTVTTFTEMKYVNDDTSSTMTTESSIKSEIVTQYANAVSTAFTYQIYYDGSNITKELYKYCVGKGTRNLLFDIKERFDGVEYLNENVIVVSAGRTKKPNEAILMNITFGIKDE